MGDAFSVPFILSWSLIIVWWKKIGLPLCDRRSKLITGIYIDLPTSRAQIFSRARSATGRFLMFPAAKASERTRARLVSPAKNRIKWRHFGANHLCPSRIYRWVRVQFRAAGTGHEKRRTFRESSIYIETCILQTPRMDNFLNPILYVTRPLFFCNFLNEPVRKRLLVRLKEVSRGLCQVFFKMQLPYGNYYTVMKLLWLLYKMASTKLHCFLMVFPKCAV